MANTRNLLVPLWIGFALLFLGLGSASAQFDTPPFEVSTAVSPKTATAQGRVALTVNFRLEPGVLLYREKIDFQWDTLIGLQPSAPEIPAGKKIEDPAEAGKRVEVLEGEVEVRVVFAVTARAGEKVSLAGKVEYQGCTAQICYPPEFHPFAHDFGVASAPEGEKGRSAPPIAGKTPPDASPVKPLETPPSEAPLDLDFGRLLLKILQAFGIGFLISLTPCVYPMIGVTAAIIGGTATGEARKLSRTLLYSLTYVFGISLTYAALGVLTALAGAPFAQVLKSGWVLLPISGVFVVLALSMFDVIQIQTPAFIQNRLTGVGSKGTGLPSKFALGLVSGVVATPCVAAPLIAVLMEIVTMNSTLGLTAAIVYGFAMLFAMAWGMGTVLIFAGVLTANVLPRSGLWMVWIKKLFGFGMLWAAVYFALPVIGGMMYDLLTALLIFASVVFLGGLDRLDAQSTLFDRIKKVIAIPALVMAVLLFAGAVNGLTNLFPWLDCGERVPVTAKETGPGFRQASEADFESALRSNRPVILDFNATWCKICKKLDKQTLSDARVKEALEGIEALKIDYDENPGLVNRFAILGVPTVVFLDGKGREIPSLRFSGDLPPEAFLAKIDTLKSHEKKD
ncbi:MAG: protein-disulfide reductase DsbD family protein [Planctomycetota bacterium]|jgi:thiol:disulfide interchange protein DsbD